MASTLAAPAALALTAALTVLPSAPLRADPDTPEVSLNGTLASVDGDGAHADIVTDSGLRYTLDLDHADITVRGASVHAGALRIGMPVQVAGEPLSDGTIQADRIQATDAPPTTPAPPTHSTDAPNASDTLHLRGTVVSVDQQAGSFVVHINDHTRTVFVDDSTDLSPAPGDDGRLPLQPGDRVTVSGLLRGDGTVVADTVALGTDTQGVDLTGTIVQPSSRYGSRDIKVRDGAGREVTVHVPKDISLVRDSLPVSVHTLNVGDAVHVVGIPDGDAVQATHVDVLTGAGQNF